jgi:hypothetical protein
MYGEDAQIAYAEIESRIGRQLAAQLNRMTDGS